MKILHTLKAGWLLLAMLAAVAVGEVIAWQISRAYDVRFAPALVAALCLGLVAFVVSLIYDGTD